MSAAVAMVFCTTWLLSRIWIGNRRAFTPTRSMEIWRESGSLWVSRRVMVSSRKRETGSSEAGQYPFSKETTIGLRSGGFSPPMPTPAAIIDDAALKTATGKNWKEWMARLRGAGLDAGSSAEVMDWLDHEHSVPGWWRQAIANAFERSVDNRDQVERADGFEIEIEATVPAAQKVVFELWADDALRSKWLRRADLTITDLRPPERVRARWLPLESELDVRLRAAESGGIAGTSMRLRHWKLPSAQSAKKLEAFWNSVFDRMREHVNA